MREWEEMKEWKLQLVCKINKNLIKKECKTCCGSEYIKIIEFPFLVPLYKHNFNNNAEQNTYVRIPEYSPNVAKPLGNHDVNSMFIKMGNFIYVEYIVRYR